METSSKQFASNSITRALIACSCQKANYHLAANCSCTDVSQQLVSLKVSIILLANATFASPSFWSQVGAPNAMI